jgi:hypothetical protein
VEGQGSRRLLSLLRGHRLKRLLARMLDASEFLSDHGIRSLSAAHGAHPYVFEEGGMRLSVGYEPGESQTGLYGGNSNWRGPVWFPVNMLIIEALHKYQMYYGDSLQIEYPTRSGQEFGLREIAEKLSQRLIDLFLCDAQGRRPFLGTDAKQQFDPHFRDNLLFFEYFDGDNGRGCGASHQTGWTGLIALLLEPHVEHDAAAISVRPASPAATGAPSG